MKKIFFRYLWEFRLTALLFLVFSGIYGFIFSLYNLETEAVLYAGGLCVLVGGAVLVGRFISYYRAHENRKNIGRNVQTLLSKLPEPRTLAEEDYQEILGALKQICDENLIRWQNERRESMDYYTTWVHQIKTPIAVMGMLLQAEDTAEHRELGAELFRIESYAEMALNYIRLGEGASDFVFREYDLDAIIRQAVHKYAPQFIRRHTRLVYEPVSMRVLTDEKWLLFIIEQLLSNAVKYTGQGSVTITVTPELVLKIADTGIGISPEDVPRIFEKGFTGYNGRSGKKSTGLGLYLCRRTARMLGHEIQVESELGKGSVFSIDLHREKLEVE